MLSQFTPEPGCHWDNLSSFVDIPGVYPAGRLDADSEGLLLLTDNGRLQQRLTDPACGHWRRYWAQVEGLAGAHPEGLQKLRRGVVIKGRLTRPARVKPLPDPQLPERNPPIRHRPSKPVSWLELELCEGRNRQVRRMTANVGLPTLRLIRVAIDLMDDQTPLSLNGLQPGQWRLVDAAEDRRLTNLLRNSPGRGGRAGGGKSGKVGGGG